MEIWKKGVCLGTCKNIYAIIITLIMNKKKKSEKKKVDKLFRKLTIARFLLLSTETLCEYLLTQTRSYEVLHIGICIQKQVYSQRKKIHIVIKQNEL